MTSHDLVAEALGAVAARSWAAARQAFTEADKTGRLDAADLETWGLASLLAGYDRESDAVRERAHHAYLDAGDLDAASRVAFWLGLTHLMRGEPALAFGWFARPRTIYGDDVFSQSVWKGYEYLNLGMRALTGRENEQSRILLADAVTVARRHRDPDLELLARHGHGQALLALGRMEEGMAELDEVMVLATTGRANPQAIGQVYCAAILVARGCLDLVRSAEWTEALARWCESQPGLVHYRVQCVVHRSEVLQLRGQWDAATDEVRAVLDCLLHNPDRRDVALGMAHYQRGELHRIRGESRDAERAYREALSAGHDPQPGLALLRAGQGRTEAAMLALRRALAESHTEFIRTRLLPAQVEVALAAGDVAVARTAASELAMEAGRLRTPYLDAVSAQCSGAIALADGRPEDGIGLLRSALEAWTRLTAPYDAARCRVLIARACRLLGDDETADWEIDVARAVFAELRARHDLSLLEAEAFGKRVMPDGLTAREVEVLRLLATGLTNREIADRFVLSERTVARHVANIFVKIRVNTRAAATAYAYDARLLNTHPICTFLPTRPRVELPSVGSMGKQQTSMSTFYKIAYAVGFTPWEQSSRADAGRMERFFRQEEAERGGPGKALDIGCGTGVHSLTLARHGWDVTGVDLVERALGKARERLRQAHCSARIVKADARILPVDVVGDGFDFVLDLGCFHGLKPDQRTAMARAVTARTKLDATLLMFAFGRPVGPPFMPTGATQQQIADAYGGWSIVDVVKPPTDIPGMPRLARKADPTFYRLRRTTQGERS